MSWMTLDQPVAPQGFSGLGKCCPDCPPGVGCSGLGQTPVSDPVSSVVNLLSSIVGAGAKFIPETKEMRRRREAQEQLERERMQADQVRAALTSKTALGVGALVGAGVIVWALLGRKKKR